ncbi:hypothetical protein [Streptomyces sp. NPDC091416]|uniref:hypothetical protein n=1 Tax=Streptomyces sp. NPDC091416 TaxID=3366003 RepID=UPI0038021159
MLAATLAAAVLAAPHTAAAETVGTRSQNSSVSMSTTTAHPGETVAFDVTLTNTTAASQYSGLFLWTDASLFDAPGSCTVLSGPAPTCEIDPDGGTLAVEYVCATECRIPANSTARVRLTTTVRQDAQPGTYTLAPSGSVGDHESVFTPGSATFQVTGEADIAVGLTATAPAVPGDTIVYRQTATNNGPATADGTVTTTLSDRTTAVSDLPADCTYDPAGKTVACSFSGLAPTATTSSTFTAKFGVLTVGPLPATATRTSSNPADPDDTNDSAGANCTVVTGLFIRC